VPFAISASRSNVKVLIVHFTGGVTFIVGLFRVVRQSMGRSAWRLRSVYGRQSGERDLWGGDTRPGGCTTAMHLLTRHYSSEHETTVVPQPPNRPCTLLFLVPGVKILPERSPISDDRRDRRKFATGPACCPAERVADVAGALEALYRLWK
jgi:hypothetical protein